MPPTTWSLSSILLITTSGLCLFPSIQALHPLTKLVFATALWQLLRLDQQLHKAEDSARLVLDIERTCFAGMRCERFTLEGTTIDIWKGLAEILRNSRRALPKAQSELQELVNATLMPLALEKRGRVDFRRGNAEILRQCKSVLQAKHVQWGSLKGILVRLKREPWSLGLLET